MRYLNEYLKLEVSVENKGDLLFLSIPLLSEIIIKKEVYKKNYELKDFTSQIFMKEYGSYLYDARPLLYSRLVKDLITLNEIDENQFFNIQRKIKGFLSENILNESNKGNRKEINKKEANKRETISRLPKTNKSNKKVIDDWRSVIES